ncbi:phosphorylase [Myxacorys almedinensis]|uniref:Phosphorylase n=1 Tax=Myxacorys almedinensis A TaxID=2690445 RepID=A0A8J7Z312_9CYAN|nr:phosphorylase [Myxacorys almedinensis]NDJ18804.1 phosphorylase [Myxacorys almedinensis A]
MSILILVPQGAEYQAVCQGVKRSLRSPQVMAIPIGIDPVQRFLESRDFQTVSHAVVMGLCGSLSPLHQVGDVVLYGECVNGSGQVKMCDRTLTHHLQACLKVSPVRALSSDRMIWSSAEKQALGKLHSAEVVDMEGMAVMAWGDAIGSAKLPRIAMVRVVSDDVQHDLPDISAAIDASGTLRSLPLAIGMIRQPIAAVRLIRGSLLGLRSLRSVTQQIVECLDDGLAIG